MYEIEYTVELADLEQNLSFFLNCVHYLMFIYHSLISMEAPATCIKDKLEYVFLY